MGFYTDVATHLLQEVSNHIPKLVVSQCVKSTYFAGQNVIYFKISPTTTLLRNQFKLLPIPQSDCIPKLFT